VRLGGDPRARLRWAARLCGEESGLSFFFFTLPLVSPSSLSSSQVADGLAAMARGPRLPLGDTPAATNAASAITLELVRHEPGDRAAVAAVQAATKLFRSAFGQVSLSAGRDLAALVCQRYVSPPGVEAGGQGGEGSDDDDGPVHLDFDGFYVALLRVGAEPVTAAAVR